MAAIIYYIRTLGEYRDQYLKTDVLLLIHIFENFRENCVASYNPAHYYTLPGLTWNTMLKHKVSVANRHGFIIFIERGIRGDLSQYFSNYAQANNTYMRSYVETVIIFHVLQCE